MVRRIKKIITIILIVIIIFNFISYNHSYAMSQTSADSIIKDGETKNGDGILTDISLSSAITGNIVGMLVGWIDILPIVLHGGLTIVAVLSGLVSTDITGSFSKADSILGEGLGVGSVFLTIEKVIFGRYFIVKGDFSITSENIDEKMADGTITSVIDQGFTRSIASLKDSAYLWSYIMRIIALVISLLTLIYVGIRMAVSTVTSDQARYKKMFLGWIESLVILMLLPYIITIILKANSWFVDLAVKIKDSLLADGQKSFEANILEQVFNKIKTKGGFTVATYSLMYWLLVFMELKFFLLYVKRNFAIAFLTIISPIITVTYPIDKVGDGKAQAFGSWFREFFITVFIQTLHVYTYLIFMFLAGNIAEAAPIVGIAFLYALPRIEKIIKIIFNMKNITSVRDFKDMMKKKG